MFEMKQKEIPILKLHKDNIEEVLLNSAKYALFGARIYGYFPFTIILSKRGWKVLDFRVTSFSFLFSVCINLLFICGNVYFLYKFYIHHYANSGVELSPIQAFFWTSYLYFSFYSTFLRFFTLFYYKKTLYIWKATVKLIEGFVISGYSLNTQDIQNIGSSSKNWILFYISGASVQVIYHIVTLTKTWSTPPCDYLEIFTTYFSTFIVSTYCFHIVYLVWLTFLVQIVVVSFNGIYSHLNDYTSEGSFSFGKSDSSDERCSLQRDRDYEDLISRICSSMKMFETIEEHVSELSEFVGWTLILETIYIILLTTLYIYTGIREMRTFFLQTCVTMLIPMLIFSSALTNFASCCREINGSSTSILRKMETMFTSITSRKPHAVHFRVLIILQICSTSGWL